MLYEKNETMKLIGKQYPMKILCVGDDRAHQLADVINAHIDENNLLLDANSGMDIFMLGYIWGKRDERKRKASDK